jgi:hypothetical protein
MGRRPRRISDADDICAGTFLVVMSDALLLLIVLRQLCAVCLLPFSADH